MPKIPATLLLEERAELAMNVVVGLADHDYGGIPYFSANLLASPAYLRHGDWDYGSSHGRLTDASILARHMSGKSWWSETEEMYKRTLLDLLADDGLTYRRTNPKGRWLPNANMIDQRATLLALTTWYVETADPQAKAAADRHVAALKRIAIKEHDVWYYPASEYTREGWPSANGIQLHLAPDPASFGGRFIMPLLRYHQATGNEDAIELCGWLARLIVEKSGVFNDDGSFNSALAYRSGHFHTRIGTLHGLANYARFTGNHALTQFVKRGVDWALTQATGFGWTPGDLAGQRFEHETCSLVDLIGVCSALGQVGYTDYWSVVERFTRNHLAACQLLDIDWVTSAPDRSQDEHGWITYYQVAERVKGAFAGYGAPNDYVADTQLGRGHTADIQACCVGSGVRGLFSAWNTIVTGDEDLVRVNLLLNRGNRFVNVSSHLPYEGRIDLDIRADCKELRLRIPVWAGYAHVQVSRTASTFTGKDVGAWAPDGYLSIPQPRAGEQVTVTFPVAEATTTESAAGQEFQARWRGDDVVGILPEGRSRPIYSPRTLEPQAPVRDHTYAVPTSEWEW